MTLRVGLIARGDNRGLGHLTWEFARHLHPAKVLGIEVAGSPWPNDWTRYDPERLTVVPWSPERPSLFDHDLVAWLDGLDVIYTAETFYDWSLPAIARRRGVATVLHAMPELLHPGHRDLADVVWAPTTWRLAELGNPDVVPVPVALDRFTPPADRDPDALRVLHVAGTRAAHDRNGTNTLVQALRHVTRPMAVTITAQAGTLPTPTGIGSHVEVRRVFDAPAEYWRLYDGHDVLAMPRKYGGLCLPAQEAAAAGLALVMPAVPPNSTFPALLCDATPAGEWGAPCGVLPLHQADPRSLAAILDRLADPGLLASMSHAAQEWARGLSWDVWAPTYRRALNAAAEGQRGGVWG